MYFESTLSNTFKSLGPHGHYGFSFGFDFIEGLKQLNPELESVQEVRTLHVLLVDPGDIRHILISLAHQHRHQKINICFYLHETCLELLARDLIFLELIHDFEIPIRQRGTIFLELFGNLKIQKRTSKYLEELGLRCCRLLQNKQGILQDTLSYQYLSFKEQDHLINVFKSYAHSNHVDIEKYFDHRKRGLYEDRFDTRQSLFDWDYQSQIKPKASIVHIKQYKHWRETGIAFEFGDQVYSEANKTMLSYAEGFIKRGKDSGMKKEIQGYWGDIACSPYYSFSIQAENSTNNVNIEGLFEILNKNTGTEQHRHHAVEVALFNMFAYLWEIETNSPYIMSKAHDIYSGLGNEILSNKFLEKDEEKEEKVEETVVILENDDEEDKQTNKSESNQVEEISETSETNKPPNTTNKQQENIEQQITKCLEMMNNINTCLENIQVRYPTILKQTENTAKRYHILKRCFQFYIYISHILS